MRRLECIPTQVADVAFVPADAPLSPDPPAPAKAISKINREISVKSNNKYKNEHTKKVYLEFAAFGDVDTLLA